MGGEYIDGRKRTLPTIEISIGGIVNSIDADNLALPGPIYIPLTPGMDIHPGIDWILGDVSVRQAYAVFHDENRQIHFAPATNARR